MADIVVRNTILEARKPLYDITLARRNDLELDLFGPLTDDLGVQFFEHGTHYSRLTHNLQNLNNGFSAFSLREWTVATILASVKRVDASGNDERDERVRTG